MFTSAPDPRAKIRAFIKGWNDRCDHLTWTKTTDQTPKKANRKTTSNASGPLGAHRTRRSAVPYLYWQLVFLSQRAAGGS